MKIAIALLTLLLAIPAAAQQKPPDAVVVDPEHHRVLLENEHVRVIEARASRGATSPMHSHPPLVFIAMKPARGKFRAPDGKTSILDLNAGQVFWFKDGLQHSWELLSGEVNVIAVEVKSAQAGKAPPAVTRRPDDSAAVDPDTHVVLFDNEHVRVIDARTTAGRKSPRHSHPPTLLVATGWGRGKQTMPDGTTMYVDYAPGQVLWLADGLEHSWEMLAGDPAGFLIEVKSAQPAAAEKPKGD